MNRKMFSRALIFNIALSLMLSLLICSNAKAAQWGPSSQWGWNPSSQWGGGGFGNFGYANNWYGNGMNSWGMFGGGSSSSSGKRWASWNSDGEKFQEFIDEMAEKFPDLDVDWDNYEDWDEEDWEDLQEALSEERSAKKLKNFKEDVIEKWDEYDSDDWEEFNTNWNNFIDAVEDDDDVDTELTWLGFTDKYGCSEIIDCCVGYDDSSIWSDEKWEDFRQLYNDYLDHEWKEFYETLKTKLDDYNTIDWENWRDWNDDDWTGVLERMSNFSSSGGGSFSSPGWGYAMGMGGSPMGNYGWGNSMGYGMGNSMGNYGMRSSMGYGMGSPMGNYGWGSQMNSSMGYSGWGNPMGNYGWGSQMNSPMGYPGWAGQMSGFGWGGPWSTDD